MCRKRLPFIIVFFLLLSANTYARNEAGNPSGNRNDKISLFKQLLNQANATSSTDKTEGNKIAHQAINLAESIDDNQLKAEGNECLAELFSEQHITDSSIVYFKKALEYYTIVGNEPKVALVLNKIGLAHENLGDYPQAFKMYIESLKIYEKLNDKTGIAKEYLNIGLIHQYRKNYQLAEQYFQKSLNISRLLRDESLQASALNNLGINYQQLKILPKALQYFQEVLAMDRRSGDLANISYSLNNVGSVYYDLKLYDKALSFFNESAQLKEKLMDYGSLANTLNNIGNVHLENGEYNKANETFKKAELLARKYNYPMTLCENYLAQYKLAKSKKDYAGALKLLEIYGEMEDSLELVEKALTIEQIQKQYDVSKYAVEVEKQQEELDHKQQLIYLYISLSVILLVSAMLIVLILMRTRNLNKQLKLHQLEIELQNDSLRQKNLDIAKAKQNAEDAAKSKGQFLSVMSHEIRTPLNAIIGVTNLLHEADLGEENNRLSNILKTSSDNLMALINDLLDISKIESGKLHLEYVDFCLKDVVNNLHELYTVKAREKGLNLVIDYDDKLTQKLLGDPLRINQILSNLIGNGIKFTDKGTVTIIVKKTSEGKDYNDVYFEIKDTGIGIAKEKQHTIFESFEQADKKTTRLYGGTGLGLSISKQLLEMLGSELRLQSKIGEGSSFSFTIRFNKIHPEKDDELQDEQLIASVLTGKRILIAEDNPVNVYILKQFLSKWNMQVKVADDGLKTVDLALNYNFDIILMDINMPLLDGYDATKRILDVKKGLPIIAITATTLSETTDLMKSAGIVDYVPKPFQPNELVEKIFKHLHVQDNA